MNYKQLLKFYFNADGLNQALDSLAVHYAVLSADCGKSWDFYADKICEIDQAKQSLGELWAFLDGAMRTVTEEDIKTLKEYAAARSGKSLNAEGMGGKALHRSLMKFSRRVGGRLERFSEQVNILREYFCFVSSR